MSAFGLVAQFTMLAASGGGFGRNSDLGYALFGISILKVVVLTMVIVMFVVGLQTLRPRAGDYGREEPHPH